MREIIEDFIEDIACVPRSVCF